MVLGFNELRTDDYRRVRRDLVDEVAVDVDQLEFRRRNNVLAPAAALEITRVDERLNAKCLDKMMKRARGMRCLPMAARKMDVPLYFVAYLQTKDGQDPEAFRILDMLNPNADWSREMGSFSYWNWLEAL